MIYKASEVIAALKASPRGKLNCTYAYYLTIQAPVVLESDDSAAVCKVYLCTNIDNKFLMIPTHENDSELEITGESSAFPLGDILSKVIVMGLKFVHLLVV